MNLILILLASALGALIGALIAARLLRGTDNGALLRSEIERIERSLREESATTRRETAEILRACGRGQHC